jgi:hypothetical protein
MKDFIFFDPVGSFFKDGHIGFEAAIVQPFKNGLKHVGQQKMI